MLPIWKVLADTVLPDEDRKTLVPKKEQAHVVRLQLDSGERVVGLSLQHDDVSRVCMMHAVSHLELLSQATLSSLFVCECMSCMPPSTHMH